MNKKLYIGYDENIEDFRIGTLEELNSFDSIEIKDSLEDFEINDIIEFIQDEVNMATVLKVKINKFEFIKDLEEINLIIEKLAGGQREIKLEIEDWISEITTKEIINKLENKLIESFGDIIEIKQGFSLLFFMKKLIKILIKQLTNNNQLQYYYIKDKEIKEKRLNWNNPP